MTSYYDEEALEKSALLMVREDWYGHMDNNFAWRAITQEGELVALNDGPNRHGDNTGTPKPKKVCTVTGGVIEDIKEFITEQLIPKSNDEMSEIYDWTPNVIFNINGKHFEITNDDYLFWLTWDYLGKIPNYGGNFQDFRRLIVAEMKSNTGGFYYQQIEEEFQEFIDKGFSGEISQLVIDLMHRYPNRPALKRQFEKYASSEALKKYEAWLEAVKLCKSTLQCPRCLSQQIEEFFNNLNWCGECSGVNGLNYECLECGKLFKKKPYADRRT